MTKIIYDFDEALNEVDTITLDKELRINDFPAPELELADKPKNKDDTSSNTISADDTPYLPKTAIRE